MNEDKILHLDLEKNIYKDASSDFEGNQLHLSISIDKESVVFSTIDMEHHKVNSIAEKKHHFSSWVETEIDTYNHFFNKIEKLYNYKSVSVSFRNEFYTLIPYGIFEASKTKSYLEINYNIKFAEQIRADFIYSLNAYCVHYFPENLCLSIQKIFPTSKIFHHTSVLCEMLIRENKFSENTNIYIDIENENFNLLIFEKSKLLLCNNYKYETKEDVLFYFLNAIQQLKIQPMATSVFLMGKSSEQNEIKELLKIYSHSDIHYMEITHLEPFTIENETANQEYYTNLTQHLCVL